MSMCNARQKNELYTRMYISEAEVYTPFDGSMLKQKKVSISIEDFVIMNNVITNNARVYNNRCYINIFDADKIIVGNQLPSYDTSFYGMYSSKNWPDWIYY